MSIRTTPIAAALALVAMLSVPAAGTAHAGGQPGASPTGAPPTSAPPTGTVVETGAVKTFVGEKHLLTITVGQKDKVFNLGTVKIDPTLTKVGTIVDITLNGATVISCVKHPAQ